MCLFLPEASRTSLFPNARGHGRGQPSKPCRMLLPGSHSERHWPGEAGLALCLAPCPVLSPVSVQRPELSLRELHTHRSTWKSPSHDACVEMHSRTAHRSLHFPSHSALSSLMSLRIHLLPPWMYTPHGPGIPTGLWNSFHRTYPVGLKTGENEGSKIDRLDMMLFIKY